MWNRGPTAVSAVNLSIYAIQTVRLGIESGFTSFLVLSNLIIMTLFTGALILSLLQTKVSLLTAYSAATAGYVSYRMLDAALDASRELGFRLAHGFMIGLAWLLVITALLAIISRR